MSQNAQGIHILNRSTVLPESVQLHLNAIQLSTSNEKKIKQWKDSHETNSAGKTYRGDPPSVKTRLQGQSSLGFDWRAKKDCAFSNKQHALGHRSDKKDTKVIKRKPSEAGSFYNTDTKDHKQHSKDECVCAPFVNQLWEAMEKVSGGPPGFRVVRR